MAEESSKSASTSQSVTGLGIAALIVGIVAFLTGWAAVWGLLAGATAVVLGVVALKKSKANKGFGITGIILGGVAALTSVVFTIIWIFALAFVTVGTGAALNAGKIATDALSAQDAATQKQIDAKKDFSKGETATFGLFTVKANSVNADYVVSDGSSEPSDGKKFVLVNITASNPTDSSIDVTRYSFKLDADGVAGDTSFVTVADEFDGGSLSKGASTSGNLVFEVPTDASVLKLQYETTVFTPKTYKLETLTYTLAI